MQKQPRNVNLTRRPFAISEERWKGATETTREALVRAVKDGRYCPEPPRMHGFIVDKSPCTTVITVHEAEDNFAGSNDLKPHVGISIGAAMVNDPEHFL